MALDAFNKGISIDPNFSVAFVQRRRCPRFSAALPIEYWRLNGSKSGPGHSINIGEGGLMVSLPEQIEVGERLRVKLFFSSGPDLDSIEAVVRVVWSNINAVKEGYYRHGLNFVDISRAAIKRVRRFLNLFADF